LISTDKIWFVDFAGKVEGPYSEIDLKKDDRIIPDTYVWREGWAEWKRAREVPELKVLFQDVRTEEEEEEDAEKKAKAESAPQDELTIDYREDPPYLIWFLVIIILVLVYLFFKLYEN
jgi:hypothetical protein